MGLIYQASELVKFYGGRPALEISGFALEKGACLLVKGPNGSGKSTFLRLLAFLESPDLGELKYFGGPEPRRECSLLLQEPWLMRMSVFNNVVLGLKLRGAKADLRESFDQAMRDCGFARPEEFARRMPGALSGGERQRAALAARLILSPEVLLLDEPTAYVDSRSAARITRALKTAQSRGMTLVCATHDPALGRGLDAEEMTLARPDY